MNEPIRLVQGDTLPYVHVTLRSINGETVPLSDNETEVVLYFRATGATALTATIPCTKIDGGVGGRIAFNFPPGALDIPGRYEGELEIRSGEDRQTIFDVLKFNVRAQFA